MYETVKLIFEIIKNDLNIFLQFLQCFISFYDF